MKEIIAFCNANSVNDCIMLMRWLNRDDFSSLVRHFNKTPDDPTIKPQLYVALIALMNYGMKKQTVFTIQ